MRQLTPCRRACPWLLRVAQTSPKQRLTGDCNEIFGLRKVGMVMATELAWLQSALQLGVSNSLMQLR